MKLEYIVKENQTLLDCLKANLNRKFLRRLKSLNTIFYVNGKKMDTYLMVSKGDIITFEYEEAKEISWPLYESNLDIRYEDSYYLVVNKRKGLLSIPTKAEPKSLYQEVMYYLAIKGITTISILNRLDKETSGLVLIAKDRVSANYLQPTHLKMERKYICQTHGIWDIKEGKIVTYIDKDINTNKRFVSNSGKLAISNYRVLEEIDGISKVLFTLETGRTHQIRVHTSYMNHPICGDKLYGILDNYDTMLLESVYVGFIHPYTKKKIEVYL